MLEKPFLQRDLFHAVYGLRARPFGLGLDYGVDYQGFEDRRG